MLFSYGVASAFMTVRASVLIVKAWRRWSDWLAASPCADLRDDGQYAPHVLHAGREHARGPRERGVRVGPAHSLGQRPSAAQVADGSVSSGTSILAAAEVMASPLEAGGMDYLLFLVMLERESARDLPVEVRLRLASDDCTCIQSSPISHLMAPATGSFRSLRLDFLCGSLAAGRSHLDVAGTLEPLTPDGVC
jgi:hypothetical protein